MCGLAAAAKPHTVNTVAVPAGTMPARVPDPPAAGAGGTARGNKYCRRLGGAALCVAVRLEVTLQPELALGSKLACECGSFSEVDRVHSAAVALLCVAIRSVGVTTFHAVAVAFSATAEFPLPVPGGFPEVRPELVDDFRLGRNFGPGGEAPRLVKAVTHLGGGCCFRFGATSRDRHVLETLPHAVSLFTRHGHPSFGGVLCHTNETERATSCATRLPHIVAQELAGVK